MVLGLRSKNRRASSVQVDYTIHIQEIKPWPPSQSLKSVKSVVVQWENGDRSSGSTSPVAPSQSKIEFNESFNLHVALLRQSSGKGNGFQKNVLELSLYEPRRDKTVKGQLLGNAVIDLAEHGFVKDVASFGVPLSCKRAYRNTAQPIVYIKIQPFDKESSSASSSFRESESKEESLDRDGRESVSALMSGEYEEEEEVEIASFTDDDDVPSYSSLGNLVSASEANAGPRAQNRNRNGESTQHENELEVENENNGATDLTFEPHLVKPELEPMRAEPIANDTAIHRDETFPQSSPEDPCANNESLNNGSTSFTTTSDRSDPHTSHPSPSELKSTSTRPIANVTAIDRDATSPQASAEAPSADIEGSDYGGTFFATSQTHPSLPVAACDDPHNHDLQPEIQDKPVDLRNVRNVVDYDHNNEMQRKLTDDEKSQEFRDDERHSRTEETDNFVQETIVKQMENGVEEKMDAAKAYSLETESSPDSSPDNGSISSRESLERTPVVRHKYLQNALRKPVTLSSERLGGRTSTSERLQNLRLSMRSPPHELGSLRYATGDQEEVKEIDIMEDVFSESANTSSQSRKECRGNQSPSSDKVKNISRGNLNASNEKIRELELKVEMLKGELREAAAIEISLYSIVAEHGSSVHKVHTPARRLSRLYIHAAKHSSRERKAHAAKSAVSGLVLAAKACGNDVPRLTFWLSNAVVLQTIVTRAVGLSELSNKADVYFAANASRSMAKGKPSPLKWESYRHNKEMFSSSEELDDWGYLSTFTAALERVESWIFSRIVESIWWQTFTPHMQSTNGGSEPKMGSNNKKNIGRGASSGNKKTVNFSTETWKKAFSDACRRLCPVRSEGHDCGCLPMLARSVMEQCVARLDVAMFNAISRESDDEIPTDPISDPISDPKVLPIPPGKSSFGAGAQLKNAIGNWSRWLTDLFGMDADDSHRDKNEEDDDRLDVAETFKSFHILNALSDLFMLPKDMLLEKSIRKEVCPTFSASMISRILSSFVPDEFCPDAIPDEVFEALDSEGSDEDGISYCPCSASPILYSPPSVASVEKIIGDVRSTPILRRSGSSVLRKCHTSDDELDELVSPLASIMIESSSSSPATELKGNCRANVVRYQLLRDVWKYDD